MACPSRTSAVRRGTPMPASSNSFVPCASAVCTVIVGQASGTASGLWPFRRTRNLRRLERRGMVPASAKNTQVGRPGGLPHWECLGRRCLAFLALLLELFVLVVGGQRVEDGV